MLNWQKSKNRIFTKVISLLILQAFLCVNIGYTEPSNRSMFKNKRPNYKAIQERRENALQEKKDSLSEKRKPKKSSYKKDSDRRIKTISLKDLSSIYIPEELGRVTEVYQAEESQEHGTMPLVVHIQDLHTNPEGQLNLASILEVLITNYGLNLVCSEGAEGEVDTSSVSSFPDYEVREKTARLFINSGELTGEEYLSITKYPDLPIWGIEDKDIYFKNIIEFNKIMRLSPETQAFTRQVQEALERLKPRMYSKELLEIDAKEREYEENKVEIDEYLDYLLGLGQVWREQIFASSKYKNIALFKETFELEKNVNQDKVIKESQGLLLKLKGTLDERGDKSEREKLFTKASLFKDQKISPFSFYSYMDTLAQRYLRDYLGRYPNLFAFVVYLEKINSLDSVQLFQEIEELTYEAKDFLSVSENQKLLTKALRHIKFIEDFFNLKVSNEELDYYLANKEEHAVSFFKTFLDYNLKKYSINSFVDFNEDLVDGNLPELEHFYEIAKKRDIAMFNNTVREIEKRKTKIAALIMGGFHTRGVTQLLKEKGYSYVVISPYSSTEIDEENYRYLLSGKRKPLSDLIDELNELLRPPLGYANEDFWEGYEKKFGKISDQGDEQIIISVLMITKYKKDSIQNLLSYDAFRKGLNVPIDIRKDKEGVMYVKYKGNCYFLQEEAPNGSVELGRKSSTKFNSLPKFVTISPLREARRISRRKALKMIFFGTVGIFLAGYMVYWSSSSDEEKNIRKYLTSPIHKEKYGSKEYFKEELKYFLESKNTKENLLDEEKTKLIEDFLDPFRKKAIEFAGEKFNLEPELIAAFLFEEASDTDSRNKIVAIYEEGIAEQIGDTTVGLGNVKTSYMEEDDVLGFLYNNRERIKKDLPKDKNDIEDFNDFISAYEYLEDSRENISGNYTYERYEEETKAYENLKKHWLIETEGLRKNVLKIELINILVASYVMRREANSIEGRNREVNTIPNVSVMLQSSESWIVEDYKEIPDELAKRYSIFNSTYYPPYAYQYFLAARYIGLLRSETGEERSLGKVKMYIDFLRSAAFKRDEELSSTTDEVISGATILAPMLGSTKRVRDQI